MSGRLRCYVCGEPLQGEFALLAWSVDADRVFVTHGGECLGVVDKRQLGVVMEVGVLPEQPA